MKLFTIILLSFILMFATSCETSKSKQKGGRIQTETKHSDVQIDQPENAEEPAQLDFSEDGAIVRYDKGDILRLDIETRTDGTIKKTLDFSPQNKNELEITNTEIKAHTGKSYENVAEMLNVFLENSKFIMWAGVGFLVAGGVFAGFFRDVKSGIVLAGIGAMMLGGYAILPQIYTNWLLVCAVGIVVIPLFWWFAHKKTKRVMVASVKAYEWLKIKYPDVAREMSKEFKVNLDATDLNVAKQVKEGKIK